MINKLCIGSEVIIKIIRCDDFNTIVKKSKQVKFVNIAQNVKPYRINERARELKCSEKQKVNVKNKMSVKNL